MSSLIGATWLGLSKQASIKSMYNLKDTPTPTSTKTVEKEGEEGKQEKGRAREGGRTMVKR